MDNGVRLRSLHLPQAQGVSLYAFARAGSVYENPKISGVSHFLEHLHLAVTRRFPTRREASRALEKVSGWSNAHTRRDAIAFGFDAGADCLADAAGLLVEILEIRDYPRDIVEQERRLVLNEIPFVEPTTFDYVYASVLPRHPLRLSPVGTRRSLSKLSHDQIAAFDRRAFAPHHLVISLAGEFTQSRLFRLRSEISKLTAPASDPLDDPPCPDFSLPRFQRTRPGSKYRRVDIGFVLNQELTEQDIAALKLLELALSSPAAPLFEKIRYGPGSTYHCSVESEQICRPFVFCITGMPHRQDRDGFVETVLRELDRIRRGDSVEDWFHIVRQSGLQRIHHILTGERSLTAYWMGYDTVKLTPHGIGDPNESIRVLRELTAADVVRLAARLFSRDRIFVLFDGSTRLLDKRRVRRIVDRCL